MKTGYRNRERGAVLIVALLFLVMLTLLGVTALTGTTMEERMAGNARDNNVAFQAAESALRDARRDLESWPETEVPPGVHNRLLPIGWPLNVSNFGVSSAPGSCNTSATKRGLCLPAAYFGGGNAQLPAVPAHSFTDTGGGAPTARYGEFTNAPQLEGVAQQPRYLIEMFCLARHDETIGGPRHCNFFRITAVGFGANPATTVALQEIIAKEAL